MTLSKLPNKPKPNKVYETIDNIIEVVNTGGGGGGGGASRNIGEIVQSTIPLEDAGLHLLDGSLISGDGIYSNFVDYIASIYNSTVEEYSKWTNSTYGTCYGNKNIQVGDTLYSGHPTDVIHVAVGTVTSISGDTLVCNSSTFTRTTDLIICSSGTFCTETDWQTSVNTYGVCGKFVYDSANSTVRLPKITGFTESTIDVTTLGDLTEAGLPNITGWIKFNGIDPATSSGSRGGAFTKTNASGAGNSHDAGTSNATVRFDLNASLSSSIYGNSETVQPQSVKVLYYIVVANSTKTEIEVDIDNIATELNTCLDTKRYDGQWVSKLLAIEDNSSGTSIAKNASISADLSSYLPNDNHIYEVIINCWAYTGQQSGNMFGLTADGGILTLHGTTVSSNGVFICGARTRSSSNVLGVGSAIVPISTSRTLKVYNIGNSAAGITYLALVGYRRVGTND